MFGSKTTSRAATSCLPLSQDLLLVQANCASCALADLLLLSFCFSYRVLVFTNLYTLFKSRR